MNLYPISISPKHVAENLADIHLNPCIEFSVRILNAILHRVYEKDVCVIHCANGEVDYSILGIKILPPLWKNWQNRSNSTAKWVDWTQTHYRHFWWVYTSLWYLNKERIARFGGQPHAEWKIAENWNVSKLFRRLPRDEEQGTTQLNMAPPAWFPITPDVRPFISPERDINQAYEAYYIKQLSHVRARWTGRQMPSFIASKAA